MPFVGCYRGFHDGALFPLPDWFQVNSQDDASAYLQIISDTIGDPAAEKTWGCLNTLDESHSNEGRILQQYRTWLLTGHLSELLEFHAQYAIFTMQQHDARSLGADGICTDVKEAVALAASFRTRPA